MELSVAQVCCIAIIALGYAFVPVSKQALPQTSNELDFRFSAVSSVPPLPKSWPGWRTKNRNERQMHLESHLQFHTLPNFTRTGFQLRQTPPEVHRLLQERLRQVYNDDTTGIEDTNAVVGAGDPSTPALMYDMSDTQAILEQLRPIHEQWANTDLVPTSMYAFRVYRNGNTLTRHVDLVNTHVVSSIVHVASDIDEPWPLVISDNTGVEHAVSLQPGQMLFYESAKLPHARPTPMKGRYYTSVFVHYKPKQWPINDRIAFYAKYMPEGWDQGVEDDA